MKNVIWAYCTFFVFSSAYATTFIPISFDRQVREADAAVVAVYQGHQYKRIGGQVTTEAHFKVLEFSGIRPNEINNKNLFSVVYPGGSWQGLNYQISGAPKFEQGQEVLLLLSRTRAGNGLSNFTLGKYHIHKEGGKRFFTSSVFPEHESLGRLPESKVKSTFEKYFGTPLISMASQNEMQLNLAANLNALNQLSARSRQEEAPVYMSPSIQRRPASVYNEYRPKEMRRSPAQQDPGGQRSSFLWVALSFFAMGACAAVMRKKQRG